MPRMPTYFLATSGASLAAGERTGSASPGAVVGAAGYWGFGLRCQGTCTFVQYTHKGSKGRGQNLQKVWAFF